VFGFAGFCQTVETAAEFDHATGVAQPVQGVGVHAERDQISGAQCAALIAKSLQCSVGVTGLHGG
jgi:hypothetical protein